MELIDERRWRRALEAAGDRLWSSDVIVLAIPLPAYPKVLAGLAGHLRPETLVVDVCSVKLRPAELLTQFLPGHPNLLLTHPLFGPQSAAHGTAGHHLVVTSERGERARKLVGFCERELGLVIDRMSADKHDRIMAQVHSLTFFVARGLSDMGLTETPIMTPSFQMVLDLVAFNDSQSDELFRTIEEGNPFAVNMRRRLIASLERTDEELAA
jgi:prephenate dehydrogenase